MRGDRLRQIRRMGGVLLGLSVMMGPVFGAASIQPEGTPSGQRSSKAGLYEGFQPLAESMAFRQYQRRPKNDLSKLLFLIDRFGQSKVEIIYDGFHFEAAKAAGMARWFLSRNYKKQTPQEWIFQWCNTTVPRGKIILVKLPDGSTELGREVLLGELAALEALEAELLKA